MFEQEYAPRWRKAYKISTILHDYCGEHLQNMVVLDLGCGDGVITHALSERVSKIVGVDIDEPALYKAQIDALSQVTLTLGDGAKLPFPDKLFDVVICAQVYEHAADQNGLASEIWRILQPNGVCFFSGPNRLAIVEEHYWLPFLSWFPQRLSDLYLKLTKRGDYYDIKPLLHWQLRQLWKGFSVIDYTPSLFNKPQQFGVDDELGRFLWVSKLPLMFWKLIAPFLPNFNWILVKNDER